MFASRRESFGTPAAKRLAGARAGPVSRPSIGLPAAAARPGDVTEQFAQLGIGEPTIQAPRMADTFGEISAKHSFLIPKQRNPLRSKLFSDRERPEPS